MKNSRVCPKCHSKDIILIEGKAGPYGSGNNIPAGLLLKNSVLVNRYVCCKCGFTEEWIDTDTNDLERLKEKYGK